MPLTASTDGYTQGIGAVEMQGSFDGADPSLDPPDHKGWFQWGYGSYGNETSKTSFPRDTVSASFTKTPTVDKDRTMKFRAKALDESGEAQGASSGDFRTYADVAVFGSGLTPGTPGTVTCPVSGSVTPNTNESSGIVVIQYRVQGTVVWSETSPVASVSGSASIPLTGTITGLTPATLYEARYKISRTTENETLAYSNIGTFTTTGSTSTIVGAITMNATGEMLVPNNLSGLIIKVPLPEDVVGQMLVPFISTTDRTRIIGALVSFNTVILRTIVIAE